MLLGKKEAAAEGPGTMNAMAPPIGAAGSEPLGRDHPELHGLRF